MFRNSVTPPISLEFMKSASPYLSQKNRKTEKTTVVRVSELDGANSEQRAAASPSVQDVPLLPEILPGQVPALRVPAHVDDDVDHVLLRDQVRGQRQVQQPRRHRGENKTSGHVSQEPILENFSVA